MRKPYNKGQIFGRLTLVDRVSVGVNCRFVSWKCLCACGNFTVVRTATLGNGHVKSCGCLRQSKETDLTLSTKLKLFRSYRRGAKVRNLLWGLALEDFSSLINQSCHYCGTLPSNSMSSYLGKNGKVYNGVTEKRAQDALLSVNGIDRVDNSIGYIKENCVSCCTICNYGKRDLTYAMFISYLDQVASFRR